MPRRVGAREAFELVRTAGHVLVDVRSVAEFEAGHPEGAFCIPWMHIDASGRAPNAEFVPTFEQLFAKDAKVVLACQSGNRSLMALHALEARGYTALVDQRSGWGGTRDAFGRVTEKGWQAEGLPTAVGEGGERGWDALRKSSEHATDGRAR